MRTIFGLTEKVTVINPRHRRHKMVLARIDTGAARSSIDKSLAKALGLGPAIKTMKVRSASGRDVRLVVKARIRINSIVVETSFTLADREHMTYKVLIGRNTLKKLDILIDPNRK